MNCPYCAAPGTRMETHAHLGPGPSRPGPDVPRGRQVRPPLKFALDCPFCDEGLERVANPRGREPDFLEEFRREITLVAFDLLLYHLQASHAERVGLPPIPQDEPTAGGTR